MRKKLVIKINEEDGDSMEVKKPLLGNNSESESEEKRVLGESRRQEAVEAQKYNTFLRRLCNSSSRERRLWNLVIVIFVMYNAIVIPLRLSFRDLWNEYNLTVILLTIDYIGDTFFWIDIVLRFFTPYYNNGFLIRDNKRVALHYVKTW